MSEYNNEFDCGDLQWFYLLVSSQLSDIDDEISEDRSLRYQYADDITSLTLLKNKIERRAKELNCKL